jgi:hypothetical protein
MKKNIFFHNLKGIIVSRFKPNPIDVARVINMKYDSRLFMIFDREYPYEFHINYKQSVSEIDVTPVIGKGGITGIAISEGTKTDHTISIRHKTIKDITDEMKEIEHKQNTLKKSHQLMIEKYEKLLAENNNS